MKFTLIGLAAAGIAGAWWMTRPAPTPEAALARACLDLWQAHSDLREDGEPLFHSKPLSVDEVMDRARSPYHTDLMQDPGYVKVWNRKREIEEVLAPHAEHTVFLSVRLNGIGRIAACTIIGSADRAKAAADTSAMERAGFLARP